MTHQAPIPPSAAPVDLYGASAPDPHAEYRWTAAQMAKFLRMLSATHSVSAAARSVGKSRQAAYRLRSRHKDKPFDLAWDVAFHHSYDNLAHAALERALNGVEVPVFHKGEQVGSYRKFDERLTVALLAMATPQHNIPVLCRNADQAELHARRFEALVAEVEAGAGEKARIEDPGPAPSGHVAKIWSMDLSPPSDSQIMAGLRGFYGQGRG